MAEHFAASVAPATPATPAASAASAAPVALEAHPIPRGSGVKRVAAIVTEYRYNSHAEVIIGRLLGNLDYRPRIEVASLYTDQVPDNDMSRAEASRCGIPIAETIAGAIDAAVAGGGLHGVVIIGEHGKYPVDGLGVMQYPRRRMLAEVLDALGRHGLVVPIFSDKHFSYAIDNTVWMYRQLRQRGIPFMGGSSIPHVRQEPAIPGGMLQEMAHLLVTSHSTLDEAYGYHGVELMQSLAEQRSGGRAGVRTVHALRGAEVWSYLDQNAHIGELAQAAYRLHGEDGASFYSSRRSATDLLVVVTYADGFVGHMLQQNIPVEQWGFAVETRSGQLGAAICRSDTDRPFAHFATLTALLETFIEQGGELFPAERILFSSGITNYMMESLRQGRSLETPELYTYLE